MKGRLEETIIRELITNDQYSRKVLPFLKSSYFSDPKDRLIFDEIQEFILKYNVLPKYESLLIEIDNSIRLNDQSIKECKELLKEISDKEPEKSNLEWLFNTTEKFVQEKAIYNAMTESLEIMKKDSNMDKGMIPKLLSDALAISFDPHIGHDFLEDFEKRFDFYHTVENKIPFDLEMLNKITKGGLPPKSLSVILGGVNVGKTLTLTSFASANLSIGKNVLYITLEMSEEEISKRIDANLLDIPIDTLMEIPKDDYILRIDKLKSKTNGKLIVKEYPTASASATHFKALLNELRLKKGFVPDIIYIDYINICASSRMKMGGSINSYTYIKSITEEIRGLAVEYGIPIVSATQVNRQGFHSTDLSMTETADSFALPMGVDFMLAIVSTPELEALNQLLFIQIKSRFGDKSKNTKFVVGIDRPKFRLYDVEQSAQDELIQIPSKEERLEPIKMPKYHPESFTEEKQRKLKDIKWD